ncbi:MAG TPA: glycosyltransferase family 39 protein [Candidatus Methanoperedens sp.]
MLDTVLKIAAIPLIFFIPGYLLFKAFGKELRDIESPEAVFLQVLGSVLVSGWTGLTLAEFGYFSLLNLLIILLIISGILVLKYDIRIDFKSLAAPRFDGDTIPLIILILISGVLFFHPAEYIYGNADAGVYVNTGVNIAKTGSIIIHDPLLEGMNESHKGEFYNIFNLPADINPFNYDGVQFSGFYITNKTTGEITPQFFHLYPTWIAIFYSIFGLKTGLYVTPFFGLLGILGIFYTGKTLFNRDIGLIGALLLSINILQVWFSRYPTSEMLTQFLFFSGIYMFSKNIEKQEKYLWFLSAIAFGELFLTRIDVIIVLPVIFLILGYQYFSGKLKKSSLFFIIPFIVLLIHSSMHALYISKPYVQDVFYMFFSLKILIFAAIAVIFALAFVIFAKNFIRRILIEKLVLYKNYIKLFLIFAIILFSIYALMFRPYTTDPQKITLYNQTIRTYNEENLLRLGWYLSDIVILLGIGGCIYLVWGYWNIRTSFFLLTGIVFSIFFIYDIKNNPHQIYAMRRYIPIVVPFFMLCTGYILQKIYVHKKYGKLIFIAVIGFLTLSYLYSDILIINHVEYRGTIDQIDSLSKDFPENSIVIFPDATGLSIATPMQYLYRVDSLVLQGSLNETTVINDISSWNADGKQVYLFSSGENIGIFETLNFIPVAQGVIDTPILEHSYDHQPAKIIPDDIPYWISKVENKTNGKSFLDIGYNDLGLIEGFYRAEQYQDINYRWTSKSSTILLPASKNNSISIRMRAARPPALSPRADLALYIDGRLLGNLSVGNEFAVYRIVIPAEFGRNKINMRFNIEALNTWKPSDVLGSGDSRELGVLVDWIKVDKRGP